MEQNTAFEKFFPKPLAFADKAHELEMLSKWNDAKITWETSLESATAEANKRIDALESEIAELKSKVSYLESGMAEIYETQILELQASNNRLREALEKTKQALKDANDVGLINDTIWSGNCETLFDYIDTTIASTPAQSLAEIKDGMINICIFKLRDMVIENVGRSDLTVEQCIKSLQELKGK